MSVPPRGSSVAAVALAGVAAAFAWAPAPATVRARVQAELVAQLGVPAYVATLVVDDDLVELRGAVIGTPDEPLRRLPDGAATSTPDTPARSPGGRAVRLIASRVHLPGGFVFGIVRGDLDGVVGRLEGPHTVVDHVVLARGPEGAWLAQAARFTLAGIPGRDLRARVTADGVEDAAGILAAGLLRGRVTTAAGGGWTLQVSVQHARLSDIPPEWLGSANPSEGIVDGEVTATGGTAPLAGEVHLTVSQVRLDDVPALREVLSALSFQVGRGVPFDVGRARASLSPDGLRVTELFLHGPTVKLDLAAPGAISGNGALDLPLRVRAVPPVVGDLMNAVGRGAMDASRRIRGTLAAPVVTRE